jgi:hypothetical protein
MNAAELMASARRAVARGELELELARATGQVARMLAATIHLEHARGDLVRARAALGG